MGRGLIGVGVRGVSVRGEPKGEARVPGGACKMQNVPCHKYKTIQQYNLDNIHIIFELGSTMPSPDLKITLSYWSNEGFKYVMCYQCVIKM